MKTATWLFGKFKGRNKTFILAVTAISLVDARKTLRAKQYSGVMIKKIPDNFDGTIDASMGLITEDAGIVIRSNLEKWLKG